MQTTPIADDRPSGRHLLGWGMRYNKKKLPHAPRMIHRPPVNGLDDVKLPLPSPSPTSALRTRLRHAAITETLGRVRSYETWANRVRGAWK
jgi:hypothetical protein